MKTLIWVGGYLVMTVIYILTYGITAKAGVYVQGIEAIAYLCIWSIAAKVLCRKWDVRVVRKAAFAKGMSIRQYVTSIAPPSLIFACEAHKGDRSALKKALKICVEEDAITKEISSVLFEMYK